MSGYTHAVREGEGEGATCVALILKDVLAPKRLKLQHGAAVWRHVECLVELEGKAAHAVRCALSHSQNPTHLSRARPAEDQRRAPVHGLGSARVRSGVVEAHGEVGAVS